MRRSFYRAPIVTFLQSSDESVLGTLARNNPFPLDLNQRNAWLAEIDILRHNLSSFSGIIFMEFDIPRIGKRIDAVILLEKVVILIEFKVSSRVITSSALDQVEDYALDLKNFHESSHDIYLLPILVPTDIPKQKLPIHIAADKIFAPVVASPSEVADVISAALQMVSSEGIDLASWESGRYSPTPTIIEAARALYAGHSVTEISRTDAGAEHLRETSEEIVKIIDSSRARSRKAICFVTGVPGSGKTLIGLDIATRFSNHEQGINSIYLSGNGPLVEILREALARDQKERLGTPLKKSRREVKSFVQNVHRYRDEYLQDKQPPADKIAIFDEAQRAWNQSAAESFLMHRRSISGLGKSEPEFLISCLDRHEDWAVILCLVGGGQEINRGEAGISEWLSSIRRSFSDWDIYISSRLTDSEYDAAGAIEALQSSSTCYIRDHLHLSTSMRSFRAENVSLLVKQILDLELNEARRTLENLSDSYPIRLTRNLDTAKNWMRSQARGTERYGLVASSQAERLKPHAIDVRSPMDPVQWFLNGKDDVRSSYYLEAVATEFKIQGLELDWVGVTWDADFRMYCGLWNHHSFHGNQWKNIHKPERQRYLKNAYRVLLTRARQGMIIFVPEGDLKDPTRNPEYYNETYKMLKAVGLKIV